MIELIKSGDIERLIIVVIVFGVTGFLFATHQPVDDRLFDVVLILTGFFFGTIVTKAVVTNGKRD